MLHVVTKLIVVLAALSSAAPADYCLLKLMGRCCRTARVSNHAPKSSCCHEREAHDDHDACSTCKDCGSPLEKSGHERKACCFHTPSDGVLSQAAAFSAAVAHAELSPMGPLDLPAHTSLCAPLAASAPSWRSTRRHPQAAGAPLFLLVHALLI